MQPSLQLSLQLSFGGAIELRSRRLDIEALIDDQRKMRSEERWSLC